MEKTMTMTKMILTASLVAALLGGCGDDRPLDGDGAPAVGGAAGEAIPDPGATGGMTGEAGQGGEAGAAGGQGGADVAPEIGSTFTKADHDICVNWPLCPTGIVRLADQQMVPLLANTCRATFPGFKLSCGPCIDTRTPACAPFVGRCMAMNWPIRQPNYCETQVAPAREPVDAYTVCTGAVNGSDGGAAAHLVCDDAP